MKRRDGRWSPAGVVDVQVYSRPEPGREGGIRMQQSGEAQSNVGGWGGGRMQEVGGWGGGGITQKTVDNGGAETRLIFNNIDRA